MATDVNEATGPPVPVTTGAAPVVSPRTLLSRALSVPLVLGLALRNNFV